MKRFVFVVAILGCTLVLAGCFGPKNICSGACNTLCAQVPTGNGSTTADVGLGIGKAVCGAVCGSAPATMCDAWVAGKIDDLGVLQWVEQAGLGRAAAGLVKAKKLVSAKKAPAAVK